MNVLFDLPVWAQGFIAWISTGSNIVTLFGVITALIKLNSNNKQNKAITNTQISLLQTMIDKLSDTKNLAENVQVVSAKVSESLTYFEKALTEQRQTSANLAMFVMECFNKSNLSAEAKADLKVLADKIFYNDNTAVIDALKAAKLEADTMAAENAAKVIQLEAELEEQKAKLVKAQENVKASRRV